jgi:hypothetical protein
VEYQKYVEEKEAALLQLREIRLHRGYGTVEYQVLTAANNKIQRNRFGTLTFGSSHSASTANQKCPTGDHIHILVQIKEISSSLSIVQTSSCTSSPCTHHPHYHHL